MKIKRTEVLHIDEFDKVRLVNKENRADPTLCLKVKDPKGATLSIAEVTALRDECTAWLDTGYFTPDDEPEPVDP